MPGVSWCFGNYYIHIFISELVKRNHNTSLKSSFPYATTIYISCITRPIQLDRKKQQSAPNGWTTLAWLCSPCLGAFLGFGTFECPPLRWTCRSACCATWTEGSATSLTASWSKEVSVCFFCLDKNGQWKNWKSCLNHVMELRISGTCQQTLEKQGKTSKSSRALCLEDFGMRVTCQQRSRKKIIQIFQRSVGISWPISSCIFAAVRFTTQVILNARFLTSTIC